MPERLWRKTTEGQVVRAPARAAPAAPKADGQVVAPAGASGRRRASLWLALRLGFRDVYDYAGMVLVMSLGFAFLGGLGFIGGQALGKALFGGVPGAGGPVLAALLAIVGLAVVGGPLAGGLFHYARNAAGRQEPEIFDLRWGFTRAVRPCLGLAAMQAAAVTVLMANLIFYARVGGWVGPVLFSVFLYLSAFWGLTTLYQWPLLLEQQVGAWQAVRRSVLLVLDNLAFSLGLGLVVLVLSVLSWLTAVGGVLVWAGGLAILLTQATRELLRKYALLPPDPTLDPIAEGEA